MRHPDSLRPSVAVHDLSELFESEFPRLSRYLQRVSGEAELAADLAQEAFLRLQKRGALPDSPSAWLVSVALNLFRNVRNAERRRRDLLTPERAEQSMGDAPASPEAQDLTRDVRARVRRALDAMPERDRDLLLLHSEGYRYREIAMALGLNEASVGTLLARARRGFKDRYEGNSDAS